MTILGGPNLGNFIHLPLNCISLMPKSNALCLMRFFLIFARCSFSFLEHLTMIILQKIWIKTLQDLKELYDRICGFRIKTERILMLLSNSFKFYPLLVII
ncbi:hypothetical protein AMTRI_Chr10g229750 [Amborella trichopoda]